MFYSSLAVRLGLYIDKAISLLLVLPSVHLSSVKFLFVSVKEINGLAPKVILRKIGTFGGYFPKNLLFKTLNHLNGGS